ncbi:MAG: tetratricopeptide repeat protein [Hyphomicrobiaceae bacterium]|nr:tetratricopeptide repeat protein [Hyphomicrobiaceae bacterium]
MSDGTLGVSAFRRDVRPGRPAARIAVLTAALLLGACANGGDIELGLNSDKPQAVDIATASAGSSSQAELEKATSYWAEKHAKNPRDGKAAIAYAKNLKALGRKAQALATLQASYMFNGDNREFLSEYGRLALENGQVSTAGELLSRADDPAKPDWRVTSARGTVLAKQGQYKEAIEYFQRALSLAPGQPSVLNNLAMAYTMDGQAARGEELLRQAAQTGTNDPRVAQNLALVLDLQGKGKDAPNSVAAAQAPLVREATAAPAQVLKASAPAQAWAPLTSAKAGAGPARPQGAAAKPMEPDDVIRAAIESERTKPRQVN